MNIDPNYVIRFDLKFITTKHFKNETIGSKVKLKVRFFVGSQMGLGQRGLRQRGPPFGPEPKGPGPKGPEPKGPRSIRRTDHVSTQSTIGTSEHSFKSVYKGR